VSADVVCRARRAYSWLDVPSSSRTAEDFRPFVELMADDVAFKGCWPQETPRFGGRLRGKETVAQLLWPESLVFGGDPERPADYYELGESVAIQICRRFSTETARLSGVESCTVLTFDRGLVTGILCIQDLSLWS
jgi:hypothetical protein